MQAQANQPHVVTFLQQALSNMQEDMRQAMVNIYHFLKAEREKGTVHSHVLGPILDIPNWTGYHNAVLFDKKHLMGLVNVWNANILQAFVYGPQTFRGTENPMDHINVVLDQVFANTEVSLVYSEGSMIAAVEKNPDLVTNLIKVLDLLKFRGESIGDLYKFTPVKSYCIARTAITGEEEFVVPLEIHLEKLSQRDYCQAFLKAVNFFYDMVNGYGEIAATTPEDHEHQLGMMEKLVEKFIRKHHKPSEEKRGVLSMGGIDLSGFPTDGIEVMIETKPRLIKEIIQEFSAAKRFQLFKFVKKVHDMEYLEFLDMVKKSQEVGMCAYMCGNIEDLTLMRAAMETLCANRHPRLLIADENASCFYWIKDAYTELRKYYPDDSLFKDYVDTVVSEPVEKEEVIAEVTAAHYLAMLDGKVEEKVNEIVGHVCARLKDEKWTKENICFHLGQNKVTVEVDIPTCDMIVVHGVFKEMEKLGWEGHFPIGDDYDGDAGMNRFHIVLSATR